ncbi:DUF2787 domain-containing protein [Vibrio parahaemolyticus]|uniref:DUF2787 domain-containing protein n=1 Tax=Vibrio parahaemolyticus TaxID=670 RepID=A0A7Y0SE54_VIBPH|nr:DUF2787 domain-containing protein [Vibrio parahaemolyticus]MCR9693732.1 DUF2787 domain-containing protein [Vibrio parahaemolyticus]MCR9760608.1 DUF2787 domain-containing protein [Vibrio parahaemolyticus]MDF4559138.1 DUF2787 domain-containing protein [Vibrio parahaemolyticus]MDF5019066.1 DUF2787 domain-containing protein [Vibrio parahaemolyticus]MDF5098260.1 DUF2787 domain-containing protein [Vibrio parahaemolyticus]
MSLVFNTERFLLPVSIDLQDALNRVISKSGKWTSMIQSVVFNFRDSSYSSEHGGFHPIEIRLVRCNDQWIFDYITDFAYCGGPYPELVKEVDFNFSSGTASFSYVPELPITSSEVMEFYSMWESNFLSYVEMGVFDEIKVTVD